MGGSMTAMHAPPTAPPAPSGDRTLAAVAYILTWVTGLIVFFVAKKEDKYARFNALQAIGLGIAAAIVSILLNILGAIGLFGGLAGGDGGLPFFFGAGILGSVVGLAVLVLVIVLAVRAYQGRPIRLPVIADTADRYA